MVILKSINKLVIKMIVLYEVMENKIKEGEGSLPKLSIELAELIKILEEYEDRWLELSEIKV